jgi:nitrite reductase/ring-hydroxylating ferredoxin subunit
MLSKNRVTILIAALVCIAASVQAFAPSFSRTEFRTSGTDLAGAKGRGRKTVSNNGANTRGVNPMGGEMEAAKRTNWVPVKGISSMADLPQEENVVKFVDTEAEQLTNGATNPTGAVSVINYEGKTYCFSSSCVSCKAPLAKAKVCPPNDETGNSFPRLSCDFCKATYNIKTGERLENAEKPGLIGGVVSGLFAAQENLPLPTYDLGEKSGQVLINLP